MYDLIDIKKDALVELKEALAQKQEGSDPWYGDECSMVHEIADSNIPVYNADILKIAIDYPEVGLVKPETSECMSPVDAAAFNIYEQIKDYLFMYLKSVEDDQPG